MPQLPEIISDADLLSGDKEKTRKPFLLLCKRGFWVTNAFRSFCVKYNRIKASQGIFIFNLKNFTEKSKELTPPLH